MAAAGMGITPPAQDERRGTDRRGLALLDGGTIEPESRVVEAVSAALALGADIDGANPAGDTTVHVAAAQGYDSVLRLLAERGANLNVANTRGLTPLGALVGRSGSPVRSARLRCYAVWARESSGRFTRANSSPYRGSLLSGW
jgi:hypothetical protein